MFDSGIKSGKADYVKLQLRRQEKQIKWLTG